LNKTWLPIAAGILDILGGIYGIFIGSFFTIMFVSRIYWIPVFDVQDWIVVGSAIFALATGVIAVLGAICAFRRKRWGLALMGAVAVFFSLAIATVLSTPLFFRFIHPEWALFALLGIAAIVLTALSKKEFKK